MHYIQFVFLLFYHIIKCTLTFFTLSLPWMYSVVVSQLRLRPTGKTGLAADLLGGPRLAGTMEHSMRWAHIGGSRYLLTIIYHLYGV